MKQFSTKNKQEIKEYLKEIILEGETIPVHFFNKSLDHIYIIECKLSAVPRKQSCWIKGDWHRGPNVTKKVNQSINYKDIATLESDGEILGIYEKGYWND